MSRRVRASSWASRVRGPKLGARAARPDPDSGRPRPGSGSSGWRRGCAQGVDGFEAEQAIGEGEHRARRGPAPQPVREQVAPDRRSSVLRSAVVSSASQPVGARAEGVEQGRARSSSTCGPVVGHQPERQKHPRRGRSPSSSGEGGQREEGALVISSVGSARPRSRTGRAAAGTVRPPRGSSQGMNERPARPCGTPGRQGPRRGRRREAADQIVELAELGGAGRSVRTGLLVPHHHAPTTAVVTT